MLVSAEGLGRASPTPKSPGVLALCASVTSVLCPLKNGSKRGEWVTTAFSSQLTPPPPPQGLPTQGYKVCHNKVVS